MLTRGLAKFLSISSLMSLFTEAISEEVRVCPLFGEDLEISCSVDDVIVISSAHYGRMEKTRCITTDKFIGCDNDVLYLLDQWCSGRSSCRREIPNQELTDANKVCFTYLHMYLEVKYTCVRVTPRSNIACGRKTIVTEKEGFISSYLTEETNCGSKNELWIINNLPGQVTEISIVDFGSEYYKQNSNETDKEFPLYGYIKDDNGRNAFFGALERRRQLQHSEASTLTIEVVPASQRNNMGFLLHFKKTGCPDLTPPAHAWYKRDGDQAVIGCEWSQKTWHLSCDGRSWSGVVGNCSEPVTHVPIKERNEVHIKPGLWLVCLVSVSVVVIVVVCVTGIVCIKKYRIKQDVQKVMTLQTFPGQGHYDLDPNIEMASMLYFPYKSSQQQQQQQQQQQGERLDAQRPTSYLVPQDQVVNELTPIRIWERPLPDLPDKSLGSSTVGSNSGSKHQRTPGDGDEAVDEHGRPEVDTLISEKSTLITRPLQVLKDPSTTSSQMV